MTVEPGPVRAGDIPICDRASMVDVFRARRRELGLSQLAVDQIAGFADGQTAKIETPNQAASWARKLSMEMVPHIAGALGIEFRAVPRAARTTEENPNGENAIAGAYDEFMRERGRRLARARWAKASAQARKQAVIRMNRARLRKRRAKASASR